MGARKFVVYGGRRWRELELASGRVAGWGAVEFLCVRRGKLALQPRARVLRALRALSGGGARSAAKDGPRLSQIRRLAHERQSKDRRELDEESYKKDHTTHVCCQHNLHCSTDANFNSILKPLTSTVAVQCSDKVTTGVQADRIAANQISVKLHMNNKAQSEKIGDENEVFSNKDHGSERSKAKDNGSETSKAKDHGSETSKAKDHGSETSKAKDHGSERSKTKDHGSERSKTKDHGSERLKAKDHGSERSKTKDHGSERLKAKDHGSERSKTIDHGSERLKAKDNGSERLRSKTLLGRKNQTQDSISSDNAVEHDAERKNRSQRKIGPRSKLKEAIDKEKRRDQIRLSLSSDTEFETRKNKLQRKIGPRSKPVEGTDKEKRRDLVTLSLSSDSEFEISKLQGKKALQSKPVGAIDKEKRGNQTRKLLSSDSEFETARKNKFQRKKDDSVETQETEEQLCKELIVTEQDVMLLRNFLLRDDANVFQVDLEQFDSDDRYKERFFYSLNPLVNVERCPRIARMLRARSARNDSVSLKNFITTLGLRSVSDAGVSQTRYRMRARRSSDVTRARRSSDVTRARRSDVDKENIAERAAGNRASHAQADKILEEKKTNKDHKNISSSRSKAGSKDATANVSKPDAPANNSAKSGRSGASREYSAEEDAYILRWVRGDGRASLVNGNRLWAQLQAAHEDNTGRSRSWQSLRNRYLRYLLPTLGARALPPHEAARLRAAAAAGELKARKRPPRRNSAFQQPRVRSAWGRRPRPPPAGDEQDAGEISPTRALRASTLEQTAARTPPGPPPAARSQPRQPPAARSQPRQPPAARSQPRQPPAAHSPPPAARSPPRPRPAARNPFTSTPTYSELTKRFALRHRSTPDSDSPTDAPDSSSATSATTVSADRRTVHTRRSGKRVRSGSDSGSPTPKRRSLRSRSRPLADATTSDTRRRTGSRDTGTDTDGRQRSGHGADSTDADTSSRHKPRHEPRHEPRTRRLYNPNAM